MAENKWTLKIAQIEIDAGNGKSLITSVAQHHHECGKQVFDGKPEDCPFCLRAAREETRK